MTELVIKENRFWRFAPSLRPDLYFLILIIWVSVLALIFTGENLLWIIILLGLFVLMPTFIKILNIRKKDPAQLRLELDKDNLIFEYESEKKKLNLKQIQVILLHAHKQNKKIEYDLVCKCQKGDKIIVRNIGPGIFTGDNIRLIEKFIKQANPNIEVLFFDVTKYSV